MKVATRIWKVAGKVVNWICEVANYGAIAGVAVMMLLTVADVFMRFALKSPITGVTEITEYMMIVLVLGMGLCAILGRNIYVDLVIGRMSKRGQAVMDIVNQVIGLGAISLLTWQTFAAGLYARSYQVTSAMLQIPDFIFYVIFTLCYGVLGIAMIALIVKDVGEIIK